MPLIQINANPGRRQLAVFALAWLAILAVAGAESWHRGRHLAAEVAWAVAPVAPLAGVVGLGALRRIYLWTCYAAYPVGFAVSHLVLAAVYYLAIAPIGLTMRLFRYDPLARTFDRRARTYWITRGRARPIEDYFKQI
jgi:hypothetical protein